MKLNKIKLIGTIALLTPMTTSLVISCGSEPVKALEMSPFIADMEFVFENGGFLKTTSKGTTVDFEALKNAMPEKETYVNFPTTLNSSEYIVIGENAFSLFANQIDYLEIPSYIHSIGSEAFKFVTSDKTKLVDSKLKSIKFLERNKYDEEAIKITETINSFNIGGFAFAGHNDLELIDFDFSNYENADEISIADNAFKKFDIYNDPKFDDTNYPGASVSEIQIRSKWKNTSASGENDSNVYYRNGYPDYTTMYSSYNQPYYNNKEDARYDSQTSFAHPKKFDNDDDYYSPSKTWFTNGEPRGFYSMSGIKNLELIDIIKDFNDTMGYGTKGDGWNSTDYEAYHDNGIDFKTNKRTTQVLNLVDSFDIPTHMNFAPFKDDGTPYVSPRSEYFSELTFKHNVFELNVVNGEVVEPLFWLEEGYDYFNTPRKDYWYLLTPAEKRKKYFPSNNLFANLYNFVQPYQSANGSFNTKEYHINESLKSIQKYWQLGAYNDDVIYSQDQWNTYSDRKVFGSAQPTPNPIP